MFIWNSSQLFMQVLAALAELLANYVETIVWVDINVPHHAERSSGRSAPGFTSGQIVAGAATEAHSKSNVEKSEIKQS